MTGKTRTAGETGTTSTLERIKQLQEQLALQPVSGLEHRRLNAAIRIEAAAYRKSLDVEQAAATHDARPVRAVRPGSRR